MSASNRSLSAALIGFVLLALSAVAFTFTGSAQAAPYATAPTVSVSDQTPVVGGSLTASGAGFQALERVSLSLNGVSLGSATTDASGAFSTSVTLPAGVSGAQTIVVTGASGDTGNITITIGAAAPVAAVPAGGAAGGGSGGSGGVLASTGVAVVGIGALGALLLVGGGVMLFAGQRRAHSA
jgi:hypothetical protein